MHVLVTGGTGVVGRVTVDRLLERGHTVRLFSRHAERDRALWGAGVEPRAGSVARDDEIRGAAEGCDAILHIAGVIDEIPPEVTFENVNINGTRRIVEEARRAGVGRLVYVSSLGAERGSSQYHRSKLAGEEIVREFEGRWLVCRPGNVYGPGDQVISLLLKLVRSLPVIPVIGGGDQQFQPISVEDLAIALARSVEPEAPVRQVLDLAGAERVSINELLEILERITDRHPQRVPVPEWLAVLGSELADRAGLEVPVNHDQITMLLEENVIPAGRRNALVENFGVVPTPLEEGLRQLAGSLPEQSPTSGYGPLHRQRYWADIRDCAISADDLFEMICRDFDSLTPNSAVRLGVEPDSPITIEEGATLTMDVPVRGHVQVRVEEVTDRTITMMTVEGHHLAGVIRFLVREIRDIVRFEVRSYSRASRLVDSLGMAAVGRRLQKMTWKSMVEEVVARTGGSAPEGVRDEGHPLSEREALRVERWFDEWLMRRRREGAGS
jgi:nucleoside-diphosphate-sugar epimerase